MRRTGPTRIAALALIALLIGLPGLLWADCPCKAMSRQPSGCHEESGPSFHPECCGGGAARINVCCGRPAEAPATGTEAAISPKMPASAEVCPAAVPVVFVRPETPEPVRPSADPPWYEGVDLCTLHSTLLI